MTVLSDRRSKISNESIKKVSTDGSIQLQEHQRMYSKARINGRCMIRFIRLQPWASNCKIQKTFDDET